MTSGLRKNKQGLNIGWGHKPVIFKAGDVAAAGSSQSDATPLLYPVNNVTAGDGTKGVILPTPVAGKRVVVYHSVATVGLKIYPQSGGAINGGSTNAAITIEGKTVATFYAVSATGWSATYTANS